MPSAIPDRYSLEVRLGRDGDIEEWLATDQSLDRPVLIRSIGPESSQERRSEFVEAVSAAAKTSHSHLARVFAVGETDGGAYAVLEWTGGATVADRVGANRPIELPDFLPNAAGLAGGLAALHSTGGTHGRIDTSAISYSGGHPAKLGAFGRRQSTDASGDVRALSGALESALTGFPPGGPSPSERVDGIPHEIDTVLRAGQSGSLTAADLEKAFRAAPTPRAPRPESGSTSRRLLVAAVGLVILAAALVTVGFIFSDGAAPVVPTPTSSASSQTTTPPTITTTSVVGAVTVNAITSFDPFGEGGENDQLLPDLTDNDLTTDWRTETYRDPIGLIKPGVGVRFDLTGTPGLLTLSQMSEGTQFEVYWTDTDSENLNDWERIGAASSAPGETEISLPTRDSGLWLIWMLELTDLGDGTFRTSIAEVRFRP